MNYFELFDLPVSPVVDRATIDKKYFRLQRQFHPDFFSQATEAEIAEASTQSAAVNDAYKTFTDPERTLGYFLTLKGAISENERYELPPEFLMEVMDINETLLEDGEEKSAEKVAVFRKNLKEEVQSQLDHPEHLNTDDIEALKSYYYKAKYLARILDRMAD